MKFKVSFCDPFNPEIIELGLMDEVLIKNKFEGIPWQQYFNQMAATPEDQIYYSPSFELANLESHHALSISVIAEGASYSFYIFDKRPKKVKLFFGLSHITRNNYTSDKMGFTRQDARNCLEAFIRNDIDYLVNTIGE